VRKLLAILALLILTTPATAETNIVLDIHGLSKHHDIGCYKCNEKNYGLGLTVVGQHWGFTTGAYKNSLWKPSVYATVHVQTDKFHSLRLAWDLGVVSGYGKGVSPMVVPSIKIYATNKIFFSIKHLPRIKDITPAVTSVSVGIKLN